MTVPTNHSRYRLQPMHALSESNRTECACVLRVLTRLGWCFRDGAPMFVVVAHFYLAMNMSNSASTAVTLVFILAEHTSVSLRRLCCSNLESLHLRQLPQTDAER
ncbi:hypothetical protein Zmor_000045 [Zophobas morio]|uniref:Uncharacterized protein n=1 Tax=Zophobas morio TaxID=2755281 RepID=A0AA38J3J4_9CUCU|nr:hypothetical protein Zmor_000045 [Zophobas morio]